MAGITGVYCADGRPAEIAEVQKMAAAVKHRGPDGIGYWNSGPMAFAHLQFCTTPESLAERQPLESPGGEACLAWNGRVDNREELQAALAAAGERAVDETDPGLVLAAYLAWGTECIQHIVGDFALALWDARARKLWCARDSFAIRPFYYFWDGRTFLFAPEIRALLAHPLVSLKINEGMAGEYLAGRPTSREETLYSDIHRLPSGSTLTIDGSGSLRIAKWWMPELSLLEYKTDEEFAEQFLHLMDQSVQSRMRCNARWGVELSGGLDSSTIAVTAQAILNRMAKSGHRERTLAFSNVSPGKDWDESEYIAAVVSHAGLEGESFPPFRVGLDFFQRRAAQWLEFPGGPSGEPMSIPISEAAKRHGARVVMSGVGGDEWLQGADWYLLDLIRSVNVRALVARAREDWKLYGGSRHWSLFLLRKVISQCAPAGVHAFRRRRRLEQKGIFFREFLRRTHLSDRLAAPVEREMYRFASLAQKRVFGFAVGGVEAHVFEWNDRDSAHHGVEIRYPFFDRRLAEFLLRIPESQRQRNMTWKWLLRNAMRGRLPEIVRTRRTKAEFSELFKAVLRAPQTETRLENLWIVKHTDWLDRNNFAKRLNLPLRPDEDDPMHDWPIWMVLGTDLWLEAVLSAGGNIYSRH